MAHIHEKIDFTSEVFVVYQNKVLLRIHDKYKKWLSIGGHIELNEDPVEAAVREVKEEVGLDIELEDSLLPSARANDETRDIIPPRYVNRHWVSPTHEHVTFVYFGSAATDTVCQPSNHEQSPACRWFTREEIEASSEIVPNIKFYALKALDVFSINEVEQH